MSSNQRHHFNALSTGSVQWRKPKGETVKGKFIIDKYFRELKNIKSRAHLA